MRAVVLENPKFVSAFSEWAVCVVAHVSGRGKGHQPVEVYDRKTKQKVKRCPHYPTISCEDHTRVYQDTRGKFQFRYVPSSFICNAKGEIIISNDGLKSVKIDDYINKLREAQKRMGPGLPASKYRKVRQDLEKAEKYAQSEKFRKAISIYKKLQGSKKYPETLRNRMEKKLEELNERGLKLVEEAREKASSDPKEAKKLLKKVKKEFRGLEAYEKAKEALKEMGG